MMCKFFRLGGVLCAVAISLVLADARSADATVPNLWLFSTDLGSDLDLSDPVTPDNNWMDCGAIYRAGPTLFKDDDGPVQHGWAGYPFGSAPQPASDIIGNDIPGPAGEGGHYDDYFDLDAEDQLHLSCRDEQGWPEAVRGPTSYSTMQPSGQIIVHQPSLALWTHVFGENLNYHLHHDLTHYNGSGAFHNSWHKNKAYISFDDDDLYPWAVGPNNEWDYTTIHGKKSVPTTIDPDHDVEISQIKIFLSSSVPAMAGNFEPAVDIMDEVDLNMQQKPTGTEATRQYDDDVDALDWHPVDLGDRQWPRDEYGYEAKWDGTVTEGIDQPAFKHRFWSADNEAAMGTDPGSIYGTIDDGEVGTGSFQNQWRVLTPAHFGLFAGVDIDAFEWITLDGTETMNLFGYNIDRQEFNPTTGQWETIPMYMLAALFSVDEDDPFQMQDQSGGLSPGTIYCSDLEGHHVAVSWDYGVNIDAIALTATVPEPTSLELLGLAGLGMIFGALVKSRCRRSHAA